MLLNVVLGLWKKVEMIEKLSEWTTKLEQAWNSCEFDNDLFVQQSLNVLQEMKSLVNEVAMFEKE